MNYISNFLPKMKGKRLYYFLIIIYVDYGLMVYVSM